MKKYHFVNKEYVDKKVITVDCSIFQAQSVIIPELIGAQKIDCQFATEGWSVVCSCFNGYALNTYGENSVGVIFDNRTGKVTNQYSKGNNFEINKIVAYF